MNKEYRGEDPDMLDNEWVMKGHCVFPSPVYGRGDMG
jgi:hypothetical protein